jgi:hypothetical protein
LVFGTKLLELCPHRRKPTLEDADDLGANLGCRKTGSVYKSTPAINFILRADDHDPARKCLRSICYRRDAGRGSKAPD